MNEHKFHRASPVTRQPWRKRLSAAFATRFKSHQSRSWTWRVLMPVACVLAGALFVTSAISSGGTDLRAGRFSDLGSLVAQQTADVEQLRTRAADLSEEINALSTGLDNNDVRLLQRTVDALREPAGLEAVTGPGVTISLDDAPEDVQSSADVNPNFLVVHQQDIQAVVNALWAGGAEAMTIQGQRVVSTTGIKCVGNTVVLHGVPYAPPYVISAIGNSDTMLESVDASPYIGIYLDYVERYSLGWTVDAEFDLELPGYDGSTELNYARPAGNTGGTEDNGT